MEERYKSFIIDRILSESGIIIAPIHFVGICNYVDRIITKYNISIDKYCQLLTTDQKVLSDLINQATTNETYFFREEKQFDYLEKEVFPKYRNKKLVIWSGACSTGEEPLSILALALHFNVDVTVYASDIDDNVLSFFKKGEYSKYSFRSDGEKYHKYLENLGSFDKSTKKFLFKKEVINKIKIFKYNLTDWCNFPINEKIDIIFMRNVFIYFDINTRKRITSEVTRKLNENGHLFYSINEIGNIQKDIVPEYMKKTNYNHIYFYIKNTLQENKKIELSEKNKYQKPCEVFNIVKSHIELKNYSAAFNIAEEYKPAFSERYYSSFFKGFVLMEENNIQEAEKYFSTSEFMKNEFWPVYYYHGLLLERNSYKDKAAIYFKKCYEKMKPYVNNSSNDYDFLLKDTSLSFVYSYCSNFIKE